MLTSPAIWIAASDQKSSAGSAASSKDILLLPDSVLGPPAACGAKQRAERWDWQLILEPSRGSGSCCDPAAKCELHAKACEGSTLQIVRCGATAKADRFSKLR